jgi:hypothetical protein
MYRRWNWPGLPAYGVGFVTTIPFFGTPLDAGPIAAAPGGADIGPDPDATVFLLSG